MLKQGSLIRYSRSMLLKEEESSMEEEKGWIEEGKIYDNRRKRIKKTWRREIMEIGD